MVSSALISDPSTSPCSIINPTDGKHIGVVELATEEDVDIAVKAARHAYETVWGLNTPGHERGRLLLKLAELVEKNADELAALEALDNGGFICVIFLGPACSGLTLFLSM